MIKILFFGQLRERLNCSELNWVVSQSISLDELRVQLCKQGSLWESSLEKGCILVAVNHTLSLFDAIVQEGDEVAFFPPVTGG